MELKAILAFVLRGKYAQKIHEFVIKVLVVTCFLFFVSQQGIAAYDKTYKFTIGIEGTKEEILDKIELYLNSISTMQARFLQVSGTGACAEGKIFFSIPGRMRLEYNSPSQILVISNGYYIIYYDAKLEQTSYIGFDTTPVGILLRTPVRLKGSVLVSTVQRLPGAIAITLMQDRGLSSGVLTLLFEEKPFALKQWHIKDMQGQIVTISLYDAKFDVNLDPNLFTFTDPKLPNKPYSG